MRNYNAWPHHELSGLPTLFSQHVMVLPTEVCCYSNVFCIPTEPKITFIYWLVIMSSHIRFCPAIKLFWLALPKNNKSDHHPVALDYVPSWPPRRSKIKQSRKLKNRSSYTERGRQLLPPDALSRPQCRTRAKQYRTWNAAAPAVRSQYTYVGPIT